MATPCGQPVDKQMADKPSFEPDTMGDTEASRDHAAVSELATDAANRALSRLADLRDAQPFGDQTNVDTAQKLEIRAELELRSYTSRRLSDVDIGPALDAAIGTLLALRRELAR